LFFAIYPSLQKRLSFCKRLHQAETLHHSIIAELPLFGKGKFLFLCQILPFCTVLAFLLRRLYNVSHAKKRRIFPMSNVSIKLLREGAKLPARGSAFAAGYDLYACLDGDKELIIPPHATAMLPTGLSFALPEGTFGAVVARSGLASKQGLRPANCLGVIDSDYRGECFVALHNDSNEERTVRHGDRVAQLVLLPFLPMEFEQVDTLPETVRGEGGFGSTGR
jgi:dUTP pyrophosphatase